MTDPGVVNIAAWRPAPGTLETRTLFYGGVARKTADGEHQHQDNARGTDSAAAKVSHLHSNS